MRAFMITRFHLPRIGVVSLRGPTWRCFAYRANELIIEAVPCPAWHSNLDVYTVLDLWFQAGEAGGACGRGHH